MKILAFGASSSRESINRVFARHAANRLQSEVLSDLEFEQIDLSEYDMPIYSIDRERETGIPGAARHFFEQAAREERLARSRRSAPHSNKRVRLKEVHKKATARLQGEWDR